MLTVLVQKLIAESRGEAAPRGRAGVVI